MRVSKVVMFTRAKATNRRRGATLIIVTITLPLLIVLAALVVDFGFLVVVHSDLQNAADAAAIAAVKELDNGQAVSTAIHFSHINHSGHGIITIDDDVQPGRFDISTRTFTSGAQPLNAVSVSTRRAESYGNPISLFFARSMGILEADVGATAVAAQFGAGVSFLIDDEMIDTDIPEIENLAASLGTTAAALLADANGDHFIDLPPGVILELPTGQIGDEALFEVGPEFIYTPLSNPSLLEFMLYQPYGPTFGIPDTDLDPLIGVDPVFDQSKYPSYITDTILVSPVFKSDCSDLDPWVNATGERRGLLAFKFIMVGDDPDGVPPNGGSLLPTMWIEVIDPSYIVLAELDLTINGSSGGSVLVK